MAAKKARKMNINYCSGHICFVFITLLYAAIKLINCSSLCLFQGTSTKYSPQRVGLQHQMHDEDVIQIIKK